MTNVTSLTKRIAFLALLVAMGVIVALAVHPSGHTAILYSFAGAPLLVLGIFLYGWVRWREGAFVGLLRDHDRQDRGNRIATREVDT